ncbi:MAG: acetyltransferase [Fusobacteriaceae bacterium]
MDKEVIIIGAGGHSKVIVDILKLNGRKIAGILDDNPNNQEAFGKLELIEKYKNIYDFVIAIGSNKIRKMISEKYKANYIVAIHPKAIIAGDVELEEGTVIMAGAIINSGSKIGKHCIVNTGAIIEHDNTIEDFVHISPGAVLAGTVKIGKSTWVGAGATIINNITVGENCVIGAGTVIVRDVRSESKIVGIPGREI